MPLDVWLRCRNCGRGIVVDGRTAEWPDCACGDAEWRLQLIGHARIERAADEDGWKNSYDEWKTGGGKPR